MSEHWSRDKSSLQDFPEAYKLGVQDFYGRDFIVSPDVLIPRPETEFIIDEMLSLAGKAFLPGVAAGLAKMPERARILDVGTGSGCIAITLKKVLPDADVSAVDICEKALRIAQKNATKFDAEVKFSRSDLLENVDFGRGRFDAIVANLPYVDENWDWLSENLKYEPMRALFAEDGGLALIKKLIDQAVEKRACRYLILEADPCQHEEIKKYASDSGLKHMKTNGFILVFYLSE